MTDVAAYEPVQPAMGLPAEQPAMGMMRLTDWAQEARAAAALASSLVKTSFVPDAFRGKVEEAAAAILTGHEMGLSPMAALRAIYVIKGTPAMYAKTMRAVVQSKGHEIWVESATASRVIVKGRRKGSDKVEVSTWTVDRAKTAGLLSNAQYTRNPQNMLTARATAEVCWLVASDALHGISASVEELDEDLPVSGPPMIGAGEPAPAQPRKRAQRKPLEPMPSAEPEPERPALPSGADPEFAEPVDVVEPDAEDAPSDRATQEQHNHMHALWTDLGYGGSENRDARLDITSRILGLPAPMESSASLTLDQADLLIAKLKERKAAKQ